MARTKRAWRGGQGGGGKRGRGGSRPNRGGHKGAPPTDRDSGEFENEHTAGKSGPLSLPQPSFQHEEDVGITEFIMPDFDGFEAIIKHRYEDFLVNEIDVEGNVIHLTPTRRKPVEQDDKDTKQAETEQDDKETKQAETEQVSTREDEQQRTDADMISALREVLGDDTEFLEKATELLANRSTTSDPAPVVSKPVEDKQLRTQIHSIVKTAYPNMEVYSDTKDSCVRLCVRNKQQFDKRAQRATRTDWQALGGDYMLFHLCKENMETTFAIGQLALALNVSTGIFSVAGTKDKRAVTVQAVTAYRMEANRLFGVSRKLRSMRLGNCRIVKQALNWGDNSGNAFEIVLRSVKPKSGSNLAPEQLTQAIGEVCTSLQQFGFINYYGMQRFGTSSVGSHDIGRQIIRGQWQAACNLVLDPRESDRADFEAARKAWKENPSQPETALKLFPPTATAEISILKVYKARPTDHQAALKAIPRPLLLMYLHAYQSYIWNRAVSERMRLFGKVPVAGDLALAKDEDRHLALEDTFHDDDAVLKVEDAEEEEGKEEVEQEEVAPEELVKDDMGAEQASAKKVARNTPSAENASDNVNDASATSKNVIVLTDELIATGRYSMFDVVMPIPGCRVHLPRHAAGQMIADMLQADGLSLSSLKNKQNVFNLPGGYRAVVTKAKELEYRFARYSDSNKALVVSDMGRLGRTEASVDEEPNGEHLALIIKFQLPTSAYATMALREIMRTDTSAGHHSGMTAALQSKSAPATAIASTASSTAVASSAPPSSIAPGAKTPSMSAKSAPAAVKVVTGPTLMDMEY
ncbi:multisubstrate pseudouridine synthase 7 [Sorochytrium milnesiophthora]